MAHGRVLGWTAFVHPGFPAAFTIDVHGPSHVAVDADADGRRFANETGSDYAWSADNAAEIAAAAASGPG